jgi:hypothetical protein
MAIDFRYFPGAPDPISGPELVEQTERAFNELGTHIENVDILAQQALSLADNALSTANEALLAAQNAQSGADAATETANTALQTAQTAIADAATAVARANAAFDQAAISDTTANSALTTAQMAIDTANNALTQATTAEQDAQQALTIAMGASATAEKAMGIFTVDSEVKDANEAFYGAEKSYLTNADPENPNLNFPSQLTVPLWFEVFISEDGSSVTQTAWDNTASHVFTRCGTVNASDPENPVVTWTPWNSVAMPETVKNVEVEVDPESQPEGTYLVVTFDTESGDEVVYIDLSQVMGGGTVQTVNGIAPDEDKNVQLTYLVTQAEFDALQDSNELVSGGTYIISDGDGSGNIFIGKHLGEPFYYPLSTPPPGAVRARGELFSREIYPSLWQWAQDKGLVKSEADWQTLAAAQDGFCQYYSDGDGEETFRVPCYGRYFGNAVADEEVNTWAGDAIRNITGTIYASSDSSSTWFFGQADGVFATSTKTANKAPSLPTPTAALRAESVNMDTSRQVPTAAENRPKTVYLSVYIHAYDSVINPVAASAEGIMNALNGKLDKTYLTSGPYLVDRPDQWPGDGTEINFGGGLYGVRKTGTVTVAANIGISATIIDNLSGTIKILTGGGQWYWGSQEPAYRLGIPGMRFNSNLTPGYSSQIECFNNSRLLLYSTAYLSRTNAPFDVWVLYTKESN